MCLINNNNSKFPYHVQLEHVVPSPPSDGIDKSSKHFTNFYNYTLRLFGSCPMLRRDLHAISDAGKKFVLNFRAKMCPRSEHRGTSSMENSIKKLSPIVSTPIPEQSEGKQKRPHYKFRKMFTVLVFWSRAFTIEAIMQVFRYLCWPRSPLLCVDSDLHSI